MYINYALKIVSAEDLTYSNQVKLVLIAYCSSCKSHRQSVMVSSETITYLKRSRDHITPHCAKTMCICTGLLLSAASITTIKIMKFSVKHWVDKLWKSLATMKSIGVLKDGLNDIQGIIECGMINCRNRGQETSFLNLCVSGKTWNCCFFHTIQCREIFILIQRRKHRVRLYSFRGNLYLIPWDYTNMICLFDTNQKWSKAVIFLQNTSIPFGPFFFQCEAATFLLMQRFLLCYFLLYETLLFSSCFDQPLDT